MVDGGVCAKAGPISAPGRRAGRSNWRFQIPDFRSKTVTSRIIIKGLRSTYFLNLEFTIYNLLLMAYLATLETHCKVAR